MQKLVLTSLIIATFVIPARLRDRQNANDGFRAVVPPITGFVAVYVLLLLYVYPRLH
ncbi:MAG: hypothetical protein NTW72_13610 [Gemmatimonadetes bacterium]|nr:hypothetical protein [Gemmatimonadota bacterium]